MDEVKRGDIFYAQLPDAGGSVQGGCRPVVVVQNNVGNRYSPTIIAAPITSKKTKRPLPTHVSLAADGSGLPQDSTVLAEQVTTLDKHHLREKVGNVSGGSMNQINNALLVSFGLGDSGNMDTY